MSKKKKAVKVNLQDFLSSDIGGPPVASEALPTAPRSADLDDESGERGRDRYGGDREGGGGRYGDREGGDRYGSGGRYGDREGGDRYGGGGRYGDREGGDRYGGGGRYGDREDRYAPRRGGYEPRIPPPRREADDEPHIRSDEDLTPAEAAARSAEQGVAREGSPTAQPPRERKKSAFDPFGGAKPREVVLKEKPELAEESAPSEPPAAAAITEGVEKLSVRDSDRPARDERPRRDEPRYNTSSPDDNWRAGPRTVPPKRDERADTSGAYRPPSARRGGYGDRDRGYGDRDRGYGDRDRGYGGRSGGYGDRDRGYGDSDRGYGDRDRGYGDRDRGYGDRDRGYGSRGGYGDRDGGYSRGGGYGDHYGDRDRSRGYGDRERERDARSPSDERRSPARGEDSAGNNEETRD